MKEHNVRHCIRLDKAANTWEMGLPLGNGRLGAMVMGRPNDESIWINEESLIHGKRNNRKNPDTLRYLNQVRKLLLEKKYKKAQFLARMAMTSTPKYNNPYQPAGNMLLSFYDHTGEITSYERTLDIDRAVASVTYRMAGKVWYREHFVSEEYQVFATRLSCSEPGCLTLSVNMNRKPFEEATGKLEDGRSVYNRGRCGDGGVSYFTGITMDTEKGTVGTIGDCVYCTHADAVFIYTACGTDYADEKYAEHVKERLERARQAGYDRIKQIHEKDYAALYGRMSLSLGAGKTPEDCTDVLLKKFREGEEENFGYLMETLFAYARYLLISSSRDCLFPANLQGIWNGSYEPPWQSQYTININEEMNYWMAEKCNLSECQLTVIRQIERLSRRGQETAKELYGCRGFCVHHNTSIWDDTEPEGIFDNSPFWPMGGAWLCLHLHEHYLYTQDKKFLKDCALPVMREAIRFFEDYLYEDTDGFLKTGPSVSPENSYCLEGQGTAALCMAPSMDSQLLRELIRAYLDDRSQAEEGDWQEEREKLESMLNKLPPIQIGKDGRIMEWQEEFEEAEPGHRHMSPLFGLHPGTQISQDTPELFDAARRTLERRLRYGGGQSGWSRAWICCMESRLKDGEKVGFHLRKLLEGSIADNLLDIHPPFQIDGNFGVAEALCESLVQSHNGYIEILPALAPQWPEGEVKGMMLRKAIKADLKWSCGKLISLALTSARDTQVEVRYGKTKKQLFLKAHETVYITA